MNFFLRLMLIGLLSFMVSLILINANLFDGYEYSNQYDAIITGLTSLIFAFFIFRGMDNKE